MPSRSRIGQLHLDFIVDRTWRHIDDAFLATFGYGYQVYYCSIHFCRICLVGEELS